VKDDVLASRAPGDPDACSAPFRVRFDEAGPDGLLRTSVLLRYAQDLAWYHSAQRGFDRDWYRARGLTWLARAAEVRVNGPARVGDELTGTTRVVGWRRVWARRRTEFVDAAGALAAWTHVDWVLLDARGAPTRIPPDFQPVFGAPDAPFALARVSLADPPPDAVVARFAVRPHELDPMDHVNNAVYADWLDERVIAAGGVADVRAIPRVARLEYARAAEAGSSVDAVAWRHADGGWSCLIADLAGMELLRGRLERATADQPGTADRDSDDRPA
jgi:acyl-CoA thioesterase FadM